MITGERAHRVTYPVCRRRESHDHWSPQRLRRDQPGDAQANDNAVRAGPCGAPSEIDSIADTRERSA